MGRWCLEGCRRFAPETEVGGGRKGKRSSVEEELGGGAGFLGSQTGRSVVEVKNEVGVS